MTVELTATENLQVALALSSKDSAAGQAKALEAIEERIDRL
jgi:hypothetical protein